MSDSMLSQDEVDALFKQATGKSIVHIPSSAPSEKPAANPPAPASPPPPPQPVAQAAPAPQPEVTPAAAAAPPPSPPPAARTAAMPAPQEIRPRPPVTQPPAMTQAASQPANDVLVKHLEDMVSDLTIRLAKTENRLAQLEQGKLSQQAGQNKAYSKELARLDSCMEKMRAKMEATPGYNARNLFTCPSCGTTGQLSIPVKCTHCGEEGWWGWWPREKLEE